MISKGVGMVQDRLAEISFVFPDSDDASRTFFSAFQQLFVALPQAEVTPNPGSKVKTLWSFAIEAMSSTSGPIVPDLTSTRREAPFLFQGAMV